MTTQLLGTVINLLVSLACSNVYINARYPSSSNRPEVFKWGHYGAGCIAPGLWVPESWSPHRYNPTDLHVFVQTTLNPSFYLPVSYLCEHYPLPNLHSCETTCVHALIATEIFHYMLGWKSPTRMVSDMNALFSCIFTLCDVRMRISITCSVPKGHLSGPLQFKEKSIYVGSFIRKSRQRKC